LKKVAIMGYYGYGDVGDEAILNGIISLLLPLKIDAIVFSHNPEYTKLKHSVKSTQSLFTEGKSGIRYLNFIHSIISMIPVLLNNVITISKTDLLILGGGGIIQDGYKGGKIKLLKHLFYPFVAKMLKKKVMILSVGVGPLNSEVCKCLTKTIFNEADMVTVRDDESKALLEEIGIRNVIVVPDPALFISIKKSRDILNENQVPPKRPILGICVHGWINGYREGNNVQRSKTKELVSALNLITKKYDATLVFIPTAGMKDKKGIDPLAKELSSNLSKKAFIIPGELSPNEIMGIFSNIDTIISMRLHAIILSSKVFTPSIGIITDKKMSNFMKMIKKEEYSIPLSRLTPKSLSGIFDKILLNNQTIKKELKRDINKLEIKAARNREFINKLVEGE